MDSIQSILWGQPENDRSGVVAVLIPRQGTHTAFNIVGLGDVSKFDFNQWNRERYNRLWLTNPLPVLHAT